MSINRKANKFTIFLLLVNVSAVFSQNLPSDFKIGANISSKNDVSYQPLKILLNEHPVPVSSNVIISNFISDVIVVGDTIWFGTGKGISRTFDNGSSFQNYYGTSPFGEDDVSGIAVYGNYLVVATATTTYHDEVPFPTGTGIKLSSDYGISWNAYPQPIDGQNDTIITYGSNSIKALTITVPEQNLSYDVLVTKKNMTSDSLVIWITSWAGELRKSIDYGAHFTRVLLPPDALDSIYPGGNYTGDSSFSYDPLKNDNHKCFSVTAENDSTIYVGTAGGINKSIDWGVSWRKYRSSNTGNGISGNFVVALSIQRTNNNTVIWGATNPADPATGAGQFSSASYTTDGGLSWANTLDPEDVIFTHSIGFKDNLVYVGSDNGIWRSPFNPSGFQWSKPSIIYDETTRDRLVTNFFYAADVSDDSLLWVGSGDGLARTVEKGSPWTEKWKIFRAHQNITSSDVTYAAPNPFSPDDEVTRIFYKTDKSSSAVTIRIFDFGMNPVRVLIQNAPRTNPEIFWSIWDGKRDDGMQVANGVYFYRVEIDKQVAAWGKILVLQ
jgi:hypothetical protein